MERDRANLFVLEGVLIALILLGAAYTVRSLQEPSLDAVRPRTELGRLTGDVLVVLHGLNDGNGSSLLDIYIAEAWHCAYDATPSPLDCEGRRSKNLSIKIDNYLPLGAGWALEVGNGADTRELYRSPLPQGEAVASSLAFGPEWNLTFIASDFSCYEPTSDVLLTLLPVDRGAVPTTRYGNVTVGATETPGVRGADPTWWSVTLPALTRAPAATVVANVTGEGRLRGSTTYTTCALGGLQDELRTALDATTFGTTTPAPGEAAPIGSPATFAADLAALEALEGDDITLLGASVTIYEPLPARNGTPDSFIASGRIELAGSGTWTGTWDVAPYALYGTHPTLLRVSMDVAGTTVELRRVGALDIALAGGGTPIVPIDPPYRAVLQTWLADWG